ncbi:MAG TPA: hypothetical protein VGK36_15875 [Candidatus Angelobacter sp.]
MTEQSEHLSSAQIENYGNRTSGAGPDAIQGDERQRVDYQSSDDLSINDQSVDDQSVEAHLADCASCRNRVLDFHRHRFALLPEPAPADATFSGPWLTDSKSGDERPIASALADSKFANSKYPADPQVRTAPTPECPSDDALRQLAAGLTPDTLAAQLTQHAATCDHCGPLLRTFTEDFSDDFTPEEHAALANLQSSSAKWQKTTARKMMEAGGVQGTPARATNGFAKPTVEHKPFFWKWVLVPAIAAAVAVAAITFPVYYARATPEKVEKLLAQAYTEQRTTEMRWPGAAWGEPKETLGPATLNQPRTLLAAKDAIQQQTQETLRRTEWLHLQAQSEILGGMPSKQLIEDLTKATQSQPASQSLLFDLAIANFRMGEATNDRKYYEKSKDVLDEMLASFRSSAALFDRAVVEQRLNLKDAAIKDLSDCLEKETDGKWKAEIQQKIQRLKASAGR